MVYVVDRGASVLVCDVWCVSMRRGRSYPFANQTHFTLRAHAPQIVSSNDCGGTEFLTQQRGLATRLKSSPVISLEIISENGIERYKEMCLCTAHTDANRNKRTIEINGNRH